MNWSSLPQSACQAPCCGFSKLLPAVNETNSPVIAAFLTQITFMKVNSWSSQVKMTWFLHCCWLILMLTVSIGLLLYTYSTAVVCIGMTEKKKTCLISAENWNTLSEVKTTPDLSAILLMEKKKTFRSFSYSTKSVMVLNFGLCPLGSLPLYVRSALIGFTSALLTHQPCVS